MRSTAAGSRRAPRCLRLRGSLWLLWAVGATVMLPACEKVTSESIERWKGTVKGPDKLEDAFEDASLAPALRAEAAAALVSLGRSEVVNQHVAALSPEARAPLVSALVARHLETLGRGEQGQPTQDARDALFGLRDLARETERQAIDRALLTVVEAQLQKPGQLGASASLNKIVEALGASAAPVLVSLMGKPAAPHAEIADLLTKVGSEDHRAQASEALVALAPKLSPESGDLWRALGLLGGPAALAYLKRQVDGAPWQRAQQAARALQLRPQPSLGAFALERADDPKMHGNVREEMFGLAEICCGRGTEPGLLALLRRTPNPLARYRAYEALLHVAGPEGIGPGLEAFPEKASYEADDLTEFLVKDTARLGAAAHGTVVDLLNAHNVLKRWVGVLVLEQIGSAEDVPRLEGLARDKGRLKGLPSGRSVGEEASRVARHLAKGA